MKQPSLILCSDFHLREDVPVCRTDDFWSAQWKKIDFISELQKKHKCPVICAGDLFHTWKPSPHLLSETIKHLPEQFYVVMGNHDLPQHSLELSYKCGVNVLKEAKKLIILPNASWGQEPDEYCQYSFHTEHTILVWHIPTYKSESPYIGQTVSSAKALLKKYSQYYLIVTGDNHQTFVEEYKGRLLVNPGSLTRQTAGQTDHKPCVFLWYADTNTVEQVFIPIEENVISREHIEIKEKRNDRIDAFVAGLNTDWDSGVSFTHNLEIFYEKNKVEKEIKEMVTKFIEL